MSLLGALCISLGLVVSANPGDDWRIQDHVVLEDEVMFVERNITVVEGGWLDLRGSTLIFNNTEAGEHVLKITDNGRMSTRASTSGKMCEIRPMDAESPTQIYASWASVISLEDLSVIDCGYFTNGTTTVFHPAIEIEYTNNIILRNSTLEGDFRSLDLRSCRNVVIEDSYFDDSWRTAISILFSLNVTIEGNNILDGGINVRSSTEISILGNRVDSTFSGLGIDMSDGVLIKGNDFPIGGRIGCRFWNSKSVVIEENVFFNSSSWSHITKGLEIGSSSFITVSKCQFENLSHGIDVYNFEKFSKPFTYVTGNSIFNCTTGIYLASGNNTLIDNRISKSSTGLLITDVSSDGYDANPSGNTIRRCRIEQSTVGIRIIKTMDTTLAGNQFIENGYDIETTSSPSTVEKNGTHTSWESSAISLTGGDYHSINCEFISGGTVIDASGGASVRIEQSSIIHTGMVALARDSSLVTLLNTTHPRKYDVDGTSTMEVFWDVEVSIHPESDPADTLAGIITVLDSVTRVVNETSIDINDAMPKFVILEFELKGEMKDNRTPHELRAEAIDRSSTIIENITKYLKIFILIDDVVPKLDVVSPEDEVHTNSRVLCSGSAVDNSDDNVSISFYIDEEIFWQGFRAWNLPLDLQDGRHTVAVEATDSQNNTALWSMYLVVDTEPPSIFITSPPSHEYATSDTLVVIEGTVTDAWDLAINGETITLEQGGFHSVHDLLTDGTYTFEIRARDEHGNEAVLEIIIMRDTEPPDIDLEDYPATTRKTIALINGTTAADCAVVLLDGNDIEFSPSGVFKLELILSEGSNAFEVRAVDDLGNENRMTSPHRDNRSCQWDGVRSTGHRDSSTSGTRGNGEGSGW
jgi:parallel beta-helix repeat protein